MGHGRGLTVFSKNIYLIMKTNWPYGHIANSKNGQIKRHCFGPWWWSSGQRARLLLRRSEFESRWDLQNFSVKFLLKRTKIKQKEAGVAHFLKRHCTRIKTNWPKITSWMIHLCPIFDLGKRSTSPTSPDTEPWTGGGLSATRDQSYKTLLQLTAVFYK